MLGRSHNIKEFAAKLEIQFVKMTDALENMLGLLLHIKIAVKTYPVHSFSSLCKLF